MSASNLAQYAVFLTVVAALVKPLGLYMARVFSGQFTWLDKINRPVEQAILRIAGVDAYRDMTWEEYATAFVTFGVTGTLVLYAILRSQHLLPGFDARAMTTPMTPDLAFNTALSFVTTTTWQSYAGETTMSYLTQMVGLVSQNFIAGAVGLVVGIAFVRRLSRSGRSGIGNFWVDVVRAILYVLLPMSLGTSLILAWQGVPISWNAYSHIKTLEGAVQIIAQGPVAALESIKNLGTNGGGFFNANAAHPYENPTPFTNLVELLSIAVLPAALTYTFGCWTRRRRDGWLIFGVMTILFIGGLSVAQHAEQLGTPAIAPNMEGKEVRLGIGGSVLGAVVTSDGATGSYNSMHDSYTPTGGAITLVNMLLGEVVYGGLGTGLISFLMIALLAVFVTGLMIGRSPEYLGKALEPPEIKLIVIYTIIAPIVVLTLAAIAITLPAGIAGLATNSGTHGLSEILVAYTSSFANNGQSFAGLSANSGFYNVTLSLAMVAGRFGLAVPALALAGRFARQSSRPTFAGSLPTDTLLFSCVIMGTLLLVTALTFLPLLALGPVAEQLGMRN